MSEASEVLESLQQGRVDNVKSIAARMCKTAQGLSIRECLDALPLAAGTLIKAIYKGPAVQVAVENHIQALRRAVGIVS